MGKINLKNVFNIVSSIKNPQQAIDMMLSKMPNNQSQMLRELMNSKSPQQALTEMAQQGKINIQQLNEAKNYYNLAKKFGIKINIPNEVWTQAEQAINSNSINAGPSTGFRF